MWHHKDNKLMGFDLDSFHCDSTFMGLRQADGSETLCKGIK